MLLYLPTFETSHPIVPAEGWHANRQPYRLFDTLDEANDAARASDGLKGRILVLESERLAPEAAAEHLVADIPREAVRNIDLDGDYGRPVTVVAAGGYVLRRAPDGDGVDVLLIHRRGVWDLPKGKLDEGESIQECAVREVGEEIGIAEDTLTVLGQLPDTMHGYHWLSRGLYAVKTTHWFAMTTTATAFKPQKSEDIVKVKWKSWSKACEKLGFRALREHAAGLDPEVLLVR
jgi:8-oxo-dGTP pyrophosphatase MutT (NUDIX family)